MRFTSTLFWAAAALPVTSASPLLQNAQPEPVKPGNSSNTIQACLGAANAPVTASSSSDWSEDIRPYNARVRFAPALVSDTWRRSCSNRAAGPFLTVHVQVGMSGHSIHGGYGFGSHLYGLATDWIVEATVVTADGKTVKASQDQNPDLFWAIRGAGSSFGIVTEFRFNTFAAPGVVTWFSVPFNLKKDGLVAALAGLQAYAQGDMPAELNMRALITGGGTVFDGLYVGTEARARSVLGKFLSPLGIDVGGGTLAQTNWTGQLAHFADGADLDPTGPQRATDTFYASSLLTKAVSQNGFRAFVDYYLTTAKSTSTGWFVLVDVHGGRNSKTAQVANSATAYAHRDKVLLWQFYDSSGNRAYPSSGYSFLVRWMSSVTGTMAKADWGRYANYADSQLSNENAQDQYYRDNLPRLKTIKTKYDVKGLFTYPQGVGS
ncbi:6-hydroxy-D-nicotine oxidase [Colletotrichum tanaceti]|uniref:6-hydroxy-D-nicotine oxidase n=1 Tax=Colletotrichum tanaceti TaxID=1306861 RepID=A0A4U6XNT2_9PEZI|nr:6-hydroxy-D-nicotine oxidase [Colletotrichum tanaceti]TKW57433.1 6-hydroxy-D-nicotine oxidase [Colletotrichum tanaceti]